MANKLSGLAAAAVTTVFDYARLAFFISLTAQWATDHSHDAHKLIPARLAVVQLVVVITYLSYDVVYALLLPPDTVVPAKKRRQIIQDICDPTKYLVSLQFAFVVGSGVAFGASMGIFAPVVLPAAGANLEEWFYVLAVPYAEFWICAALKDMLAMTYLHSWMHQQDRFPWLAKVHHDHHTITTNLCMTSATLISPLDLFLENGIGPFLLVACKFLLSFPPTVSILSYLFLLSSDASAHSANPHSITYFCPPIDAVLKGNVAHSLHHAKPATNVRLVPWHHLWKGYHEDLAEYNRVLGSNVWLCGVSLPRGAAANEAGMQPPSETNATAVERTRAPALSAASSD